MAGKYQIPKLEWDEERDEPFCKITIKGEEYRMTMWRESDGDDMVRPLLILRYWRQKINFVGP